MMRELDTKVYRESLDSQCAARRENPASVIKPTIQGKKRRHVLPCGSNDSIWLFYEGDRVYCLCENTGLDYIGLQGYGPDDVEPPQELSVFLQYDYEIADVLGKRGLDLSTRTKLKRLLEYIQV